MIPAALDFGLRTGDWKSPDLPARMPALRRMLALALGVLLSCASAWAHVGNPNVVFESQAGPYPVRVVIKPPGVVPGLAEIIVRVLGPGASQVTVLPVHGRAGLQGAPPPDVARLVRGETNVYAAELWLMTGGAYSVHVHVDGASGPGSVIVPVDSVATQRLEMEPWMGGVLLGLGLVLYLMMVSIAGAALRESVLQAGMRPSRGRLWFSRIAKVLVALLLGWAAYGGKSWWGGVDQDYRNNRMFRPWQLEMSAQGEGAHKTLKLDIIVQETNRRRWAPLVPDHGKWMHLFLIKEPGLETFAHLHPVKRAEQTLEARLPALPAGTYRAYADITLESGYTQTLVTRLDLSESGTTGRDEASRLPGQIGEGLAFDPDDSWLLSTESSADASPGTLGTVRALPGGFTIARLDSEPPKVGTDVTLRFGVKDAQGRPAALRPFLGMFSHAVILKRDGSVFTHVHPLGTISMAAQQVMQLRAQGKGSGLVTAAALEAICKDPPPERGRMPLEFPYWFPQPGAYRVWVQIKPEGADGILTGVFDVEVGPE